MGNIHAKDHGFNPWHERYGTLLFHFQQRVQPAKLISNRKQAKESKDPLLIVMVRYDKNNQRKPYTLSQYHWWQCGIPLHLFSAAHSWDTALIFFGGGPKHCVIMPMSARHTRFHGPDKNKNNKHFDNLRSSNENWNLSAQSVEKQTINVAVLPLRKNTQ